MPVTGTALIDELYRLIKAFIKTAKRELYRFCKGFKYDKSGDDNLK
jgi:hypothetical protein